jgi:ribosomal protein S6
MGKKVKKEVNEVKEDNEVNSSTEIKDVIRKIDEAINQKKGEIKKLCESSGINELKKELKKLAWSKKTNIERLLN